MDEPFWLVASRKGDHLSVNVQPLLQLLYFVSDGKMVKGVSLLPLSDGGSKSLGDIVNGDWVVPVKVHHVFSGAGGDGS
jgi:hypothetical protein